MPTAIDADAKIPFKDAQRHGPETALISQLVAHAAAQRSRHRIDLALDLHYRLLSAAGERMSDVELMP